MMEIHDIQPLDDFNWDEFEKSSKSQVSSISEGYDEEPIFHQGIAIVERNGKYGAIMVGGKEIVPPIYDALTEFTDGLAKAKYKGEERIVNLSGQIQVKYGNKPIFLPDEYDWGYDFVQDLCIVLKNEKYGIIDNNLKCIIEPKYASFEGFNKNFAFFKIDFNSRSFDLFPSKKDTVKYDVIDINGNVVFMDVTRLDNGFCIVTTQTAIQKSVGDFDFEFHLYGLVDNKFNIIYPIEFTSLQEISCTCYGMPIPNHFFRISKTEYGTIFDQRGIEYFNLEKTESILKVLQIGEIIVFKTKLMKYSEVNNLYIYNCKGIELYKIDGDIRVSGYNCILLESFYGNIFRIDSDGIWLADLQYREIKNGIGFYAKDRQKFDKELYRELNVSLRPENMVKVSKEYFNYEYTYINDKFFVVEDKRTLLKGLTDSTGKVIVDFEFIEISHIDKEDFIGIKLVQKENDKYACYGVFNSTNQEVIPFKYSFLEKLDDYKIIFSEGNYRKAEKKLLTKGHYYYSLLGGSGALGLMDMSFNIICPPKYSLVKKIIEPDFYIVQKGLYGIINSSCIEVVPLKFKKIEKSESQCSIAVVYTEHFENGIRKENHNEVNKDGHFVVTSDDGQQLYISAHLFDWCSNFNSEGYAVVLKDGLYGKINKNGRLISIKKGELIEVPDSFDWAYDFVDRFAKVLIGSNWGVVNENYEIVIDCRYKKINAICEDLFLFEDSHKFGVVKVNNKIVIPAEYKSITYLNNGYIKVERSVDNTYLDKDRYGIVSYDGMSVVLPCYSDITIVLVDGKVYWIVTQNNKKGVLLEEKLMIPLIYDEITCVNAFFECKILNKYKDEGDHTNVKYNSDGEVVLNYCGGLFCVPKDYIMGIESSTGLFRVLKEDGWGILNQKNELVLPCEYAYISAFNEGLAIIGKGDTIYYDIQRDYYRDGLKFGLTDTLGNIALPVEYDYISRWENGYYLVMKDNKYILLSPGLHSIIETEKRLKKLDDRYVIAVDSSDWHGYRYGLFDYYGNEIIKLDEEHGFSEIEVLKNGFLKVVYYKGEHIGILNNQGKTIYEKYVDCDDILLLDNSFFLVKYKHCGSPTTYSLINLQGNEILPDSYYEIKLKNDGMISLRNHGGWGLADVKGNIVIDTNYLDELVFEDGVANIKVKGSSLIQKINKNGIVIVHNGKNEIELPHSVYWGSDFIDQVSIVRGKGRRYDVIGVADIKGNIIIPTGYKSVCLLSNKTIRVQDGDCYGIFDLKGNIIFPPIFTSIEYISEERLKVTWNLKFATKWSRNDYIPGSDCKYKGYDNDYLVNNRSAICNSKAEIINDKEIILVGKFINGYARAYKEVTIEKGRVQLKQAGVVDTSGKTIIPLIYDGIITYENSPYIRLRKNGKYGIGNLNSGKQKMFNKLDIKHLWDIDKLGRCVYSEDCEFDSDNDEWIGGTRGVLNIKGVLVSTGKYNDITLLDNGLIIVSDENGVGLLNQEGYEILPMKYTYISSFKGTLATICINGEREEEWPYKIRGGKWGVIDNTGKFVKECVSDNEEILEVNGFGYKRTDDFPSFKEPYAILSDWTPEPEERNSYDYGYDSYRDDDDEGHYSKYGGYNGWDDNTIDEAFDGNPELTWNID